MAEIPNLEKRLETLEERIARAAAGQMEDDGDTTAVIAEGDDALSALEWGLGMMLADLKELRAADLEKTVRLEEALEQSRMQARELEAALRVVEDQQLSIAELSTPVLELWEDVVAMPIIGVVDTRRSADIMEKLLQAVSTRQSRFVILDITGVEVVDTKTADHLIKVARAAGLLGAVCLLSGVRPAVAQTLVEIGVDLSSIVTVATLRNALRECLRRMGRMRTLAVGSGGEVGRDG